MNSSVPAILRESAEASLRSAYAITMKARSISDATSLEWLTRNCVIFSSRRVHDIGESLARRDKKVSVLLTTQMK